MARFLFGLLSLTFAGLGFATEAGSSERLVHRFLQIAPSPNGALVASVEGDSPPSGFYPPLRELVIRPVHGGSARDGHTAVRSRSAVLAGLALRGLLTAAISPSACARRALTRYRHLQCHGRWQRLDASSSISTAPSIRCGMVRRTDCALLATENARKEVGATEAGAPIAAISMRHHPSRESRYWKTARSTGPRRLICSCTSTTGCPRERVSSAPRRRVTAITTGGSQGYTCLESIQRRAFSTVRSMLASRLRCPEFPAMAARSRSSAESWVTWLDGR